MNINECALFKNTRIDLSTIKTKTYQDNKTIALEGDISKNLGIVLEGKIHVKAYSLGGKNFTMNVLKPGQLFGDVLMFASEINTFPGS